MQWILSMLFRCAHSRTTFPLTPQKKRSTEGTYIVCLDCGKEFAYSWEEMKAGAAL